MRGAGVEHGAGVGGLVAAQADEGEGLQRVERETAGAGERDFFGVPEPPVRREIGGARGLAQAALGSGERGVEIAGVGVDLVEAEPGGERARVERQRFAEGSVGGGAVGTVGDDASL